VKLGHVAISIRDIGSSVTFYARHFGLKRAGTYRHPGLTIVLLKGRFTLELFKFQRCKPLPGYRKELDSDLRTLGVKHFSVEVPHIAAFYEKLKKARVSLATELRTFDNGAQYFFIKDPDGNLVEVMEAL
jgi:catechol 2,3-dioxygenase-like lactoylglutathione lyase family enzyme